MEVIFCCNKITILLLTSREDNQERLEIGPENMNLLQDSVLLGPSQLIFDPELKIVFKSGLFFDPN